mmetsp:Transcript_75918/g.199975  ORF Transcript_75918/g.199975 Transcript_75918/m.199975 type:complete len:80 (+) Transcript_75918:261-500(+)
MVGPSAAEEFPLASRRDAGDACEVPDSEFGLASWQLLDVVNVLGLAASSSLLPPPTSSLPSPSASGDVGCEGSCRSWIL